MMRNISIKTILIILSIIINHNINAQWTKVLLPQMYKEQILCFANKADTIYTASSLNGILFSTDTGVSWNFCNDGLSNLETLTLTLNHSEIYAGTFGSGVFVSSDNGKSWTERNSGFPDNPHVNAILVLDSVLFAGTYYGIFKSTDRGLNWFSSSSGLPFNSYDHTSYVYSFLVLDSIIFAASQWGIYQSSNNGVSWSLLSKDIDNVLVNSFAAIGQNIFASTFQGVYLSTNNGLNWKQVNSQLNDFALYVKTFAIYNSNLFIGTFDGVYYSTDNGTNWNDANNGLPSNLVISALTISNGFLIAGTDNGIWRRPLADIITSVKDNYSNSVYKFELEQNFPNPFNPTTTIKYFIPNVETMHASSLRTTLKVYDVLGREVATLVNEEKAPGNYEVKFDGSKLSSGVYFYQMNAGGNVLTNKMILAK